MTRNVVRILAAVALMAAVMLGEDAKAVRQQGDAFLRAGQYQKAVASYSEAVRRDPSDAESYTGLGNAYEKLGKPEQAASAFEKSAELFEKRAEQGNVKTPAAKPAAAAAPVATAAAPPPPPAPVPAVTTPAPAKPAATFAGAPPTGVYECYTARATFGAPGCVKSAIGCMGMQIQVAPTVMFGLIDGSTYSDYDGKKGHYTYNGQMLTMTDGSRKGWNYRRTANTSFQMVDPQGKDTEYTCPLNPKKDPLKRPW